MLSRTILTINGGMVWNTCGRLQRVHRAKQWYVSLCQSSRVPWLFCGKLSHDTLSFLTHRFRCKAEKQHHSRQSAPRVTAVAEGCWTRSKCPHLHVDMGNTPHLLMCVINSLSLSLSYKCTCIHTCMCCVCVCTCVRVCVLECANFI